MRKNLTTEVKINGPGTKQKKTNIKNKKDQTQQKMCRTEEQELTLTKDYIYMNM